MRSRAGAQRTAAAKTEGAVERKLAELPRLGRSELQQRWQELFGCPAPPRVRRDLLRRIIAHRIQERAYGGLKPATVRQLRRLVEGRRSGAPTATPSLRSGTRLMREWNGETHVVDVTPEGFVWRNKPYRSLSVIARAITGARWSGPRFFGLKGPRR